MQSELIPELWYSEMVRPSPSERLEKLKLETFWVRMMKTVIPIPELDSVLGIRRANGFLFQGSSGTGRHTLAKALAGSLSELGYTYIHITGRDFESDLRDRVMTLYQNISAEHPMILVCESLSSCKDAEELATYLGQVLGKCEVDNLPFVFLLIAEAEEEIPDVLLRRLYICQFKLPDLDERIRYFEATLGKGFPLKQGLKPKDLAVESDGLNLRQLYQSLRFAQRALKEQAILEYKRHYEMGADAIKRKEITLDLPMFRSIVAHLKTPEKPSAQAPIQIVQTAAAPVAAPASPISDSKEPESRTEKMKKAASFSDFLDTM